MPNTIADNLQRLVNAKSAIASAITTRGGTVASGDGLEDFASDIAAIPNTYTTQDEGKVVSSGALVAQSSSSTSSNGTVDTTLINSLAISVPTYSAADNGKVVQNGELVAQSTHKPITANATGIDTTNYSSVDVAVQNSYEAGDEGKVVQNGELVSQTSTSATTNGTIDTTTNNSVTVNVPNTYTQNDEGKVVSNGVLVAQTAYPSEITSNNTYDTTNYKSVKVNVPSASDAYKLSFTSSAYRGIVTSELYSINSNSSTSVFGYFVLTPTVTSTGDSLAFSFDSAFTPSFTSKKLDNFSGLSTGRNCSGGINSTTGKYIVNITGSSSYVINAGVTYTIYIQTLFV